MKKRRYEHPQYLNHNLYREVILQLQFLWLYNNAIIANQLHNRPAETKEYKRSAARKELCDLNETG